MTLFANTLQAALRKRKSIAIPHLVQLKRDICIRHLRTDGILQTVGALPLAVGAGVTKLGNAVVGDVAVFFGAHVEPIPLPEGYFPYTRRNVASISENISKLVHNILHLHLLQALANAAKSSADIFDLFGDTLLDAGTTVFCHTYSTRRIQEPLFSDPSEVLPQFGLPA
ncbi:hypothetical protein COU76_04510 [Candidatus Peregrinibacteria bacterium CG10_big_fil_rev_8_21_14_0_10_49_10]|nr:MAG: hypothetical protein COU76_04510 [Candidatus Peregrinibacteria bacterium CG10_big_fil_rev_8_21_14_0_10_49_10]